MTARRIGSCVCALAQDEEGASLVEYALLLALIAVIAIAAISIVGGEVNSSFVEVGSGF